MFHSIQQLHISMLQWINKITIPNKTQNVEKSNELKFESFYKNIWNNTDLTTNILYPQFKQTKGNKQQLMEIKVAYYRKESIKTAELEIIHFHKLKDSMRQLKE